MEPSSSEVKGRHLDVGQSWVQSLTSLPTSSVTLQCHLALSLTQFYHLQNEDNTGIYLVRTGEDCKDNVCKMLIRVGNT